MTAQTGLEVAEPGYERLSLMFGCVEMWLWSNDVIDEPASDDDFRRRNTSREGHAVVSAPGADPSRVGPYRIVRRLGRGGMGEVFLAMRDDGPIQRAVALKVVRVGFDVGDVLTRFERERQILSALDHPNIARLIDAGQTEDGVPYFIMEFVDGLPLHEHCDARRLTIPERLDLFTQVCSAVHHAHRNLVVHRDIKPRNILVTRDGVPKLLDFGIAKILNPGMSPLVELPTGAGLQLMTPEYASPEQVRGEAVTTAADVYSLGVVLFELLTGHRPFRLKTRVPAEVERVVCLEDPQRPSEAISRIEEELVEITGPDGKTTSASTATITPESVSKARGGGLQKLRRVLEGDLDTIVLKALRKEPQRRYTSAQELADDIRRHLRGDPVIARPDTFAYRASKFMRRHRGAVSAAALSALALVSGSAGVAWQASVARAERNKAFEAQHKADRRADEIRKIANDVLVAFPDTLARIDGSTEARELLVNWGLSYLKRLQDEMGDNPELIDDLALGYQKVGEVRSSIRNPSRSGVGTALEYFETALRLRRQQVAAEPGNVESERKLAGVLLLLGDEHRQAGEFSAAKAHYHESLNIWEQLNALPTFDAGDQRGLAVALAADGDMRFKDRDLDGAALAFERSVSLRRQLLANAPEQEQANRDLSVGLYKLGWVAENQGRLDVAERLYSEAVSIRAQLAAAQPDRRTRRDLMTAQAMLAGLMLRQEQFGPAIQAYESRLQVAASLAAADPLDARAALDEAMAQNDLGHARLQSGDPEAALESFESAIDGFARLLEGSPRNRSAAEGLATAHELLALAVDELGADPTRAVDHAMGALVLRQREPLSLQPDPLSVARLQTLTAVLQMRADYQQEPRGLLAAALAWFEGLDPNLAEAGDLQANWAKAEFGMGQWLALMGDPTGAALRYERALSHLIAPDAEILVGLAETRWSAGDLEQVETAVNEARHAVSSMPDRPLKNRLLSRLAALETEMSSDTHVP